MWVIARLPDGEALMPNQIASCVFPARDLSISATTGSAINQFIADKLV
jgi:hypothetical protein